MRISTQVFLRIEGERKVLSHIDSLGLSRPMEVEIDLDECLTCGALLLGETKVRHEEWHREWNVEA